VTCTLAYNKSAVAYPGNSRRPEAWIQAEACALDTGSACTHSSRGVQLLHNVHTLQTGKSAQHSHTGKHNLQTRGVCE
jgi:hypothetical protein